jgi:hypothetical protein
MSTTALIVEMLVVGLQFGIWLLMIVMLVSGLNFTELAQKLKDVEKFAAPLAFVGVGVLYTLGVVFDTLTALIEDLVEDKLFASAEQIPNRRELRQRLRLKDIELTQALDSDQYRLRLVRSTAFNFIPIAVIGSILVLTTSELRLYEHIVYVVLLLGLAVTAAYGWYRRRESYHRDRVEFYKALKKTLDAEDASRSV